MSFYGILAHLQYGTSDEIYDFQTLFIWHSGHENSTTLSKLCAWEHDFLALKRNLFKHNRRNWEIIRVPSIRQAPVSCSTEITRVINSIMIHSPTVLWIYGLKWLHQQLACDMVWLLSFSSQPIKSAHYGNGVSFKVHS